MHLSPPLTLSSRPERHDWPSDAVLLSGLSGDVWGAGRALVRRHQGRVYGLALSMVGDPVRAEEIAHETFLRAWRDAGSYEAKRGSVSTWLLTITRDLARRPAGQSRVRAIDAATALPTGEGDARSVHVDSDTAAAHARTAFSNLPVEQGRALVLAAIYGYTTREISEAESITVTTAKARLRSAIEGLRLHRAHAPIVHDHEHRPSVTTRQP